MHNPTTSPTHVTCFACWPAVDVNQPDSTREQYLDLIHFFVSSHNPHLVIFTHTTKDGPILISTAVVLSSSPSSSSSTSATAAANHQIPETHSSDATPIVIVKQQGLGLSLHYSYYGILVHDPRPTS
jgi:hypothetical protein